MTAPAIQQIPFVDLSAIHDPLVDEMRAAINGVLERNDYILGDDVRGFEEEFAAYCEADHGVGVDSGTSALELSLRALGVGPGDEVITSANTFIATALAATAVGARPVLIDIDPLTQNLDPNRIEAAITDRTRAIIPVHLYGHPAPMDEIMQIAEAHGLSVIEDASQAHGARYKGRRVGGIGHVGAFSLYPSKNLGALGDAGVLVTNDSDLAESIRHLRNWGSTVKYQHDTVGWNRRLDTLQAAVLRIKLRHLDGWNASRREIASRYDELFDDRDLPIRRPHTASWAESVYHLYVVAASERDDLQRHLQSEGVGTVIHYPTPIHLQPAYADLGYGVGDFPITERAATEILSLPMFPGLSLASVDRVVDAVAAWRR
jgi:dTDP-4-amino-4,6-dideoxygalactose transaminase